MWGRVSVRAGLNAVGQQFWVPGIPPWDMTVIASHNCTNRYVSLAGNDSSNGTLAFPWCVCVCVNCVRVYKRVAFARVSAMFAHMGFRVVVLVSTSSPLLLHV